MTGSGRCLYLIDTSDLFAFLWKVVKATGTDIFFGSRAANESVRTSNFTAGCDRHIVIDASL